jgi:hypothetical protein
MGLRLAAAALVPVALGGCDLPEVIAGKQKTAAAPAAAGADSWIITAEGERKKEDQEPKAEAAPDKDDVLPQLPEPAHVEPPDPRCVGAVTPGKIAPLDVDAGITTATVSWYHPGDPSVLTYRVTSINQKLVVGNQKPLAWQETKPEPGCATLTATVRGLQPDTPYVFSVDVARRATLHNAARAATVARSGAIYTN